MLDADFLQRPLAQQIIRALDDTAIYYAFGKTHRPEEQAKLIQARETLDKLRALAPVTYAAVLRKLGRRVSLR